MLALASLQHGKTSDVLEVTILAKNTMSVLKGFSVKPAGAMVQTRLQLYRRS